jgi:hypothetical protein
MSEIIDPLGLRSDTDHSATVCQSSILWQRSVSNPGVFSTGIRSNRPYCRGATLRFWDRVLRRKPTGDTLEATRRLEAADAMEPQTEELKVESVQEVVSANRLERVPCQYCGRMISLATARDNRGLCTACRREQKAAAGRRDERSASEMVSCDECGTMILSAIAHRNGGMCESCRRACARCGATIRPSVARANEGLCQSCRAETTECSRCGATIPRSLAQSNGGLCESCNRALAQTVLPGGANSARQADHYIIRVHPANVMPVDLLIVRVIEANGYVLGSATVDFRFETQIDDAYMAGLVFVHQENTGMPIDMGQSRTHNVSGSVTGRLVAIHYRR